MDLKGAGQALQQGKSRTRSAAFPFELAYRLIAMYSLQQDIVLDPFLGTGTTQAAAAAACRNSIGIEKEVSLLADIHQWMGQIVDFANQYHTHRLARHMAFADHWIKTHQALKHHNRHYDFPVMTAQETDLFLYELQKTHTHDNQIGVYYTAKPHT